MPTAAATVAPNFYFSRLSWSAPFMNKTIPKNTICLWYNKDALDAARFYAATFPDSKVGAVHHAPSDYPSGKADDILVVEFTVLGIP